jgi:oxysterol-binding protein-related protein 8
MAKPYNPIIGEQFNCSWEHKDSTTKFFSEQVSHHPPISASYMVNSEKNFRAWFSVECQSKFLGNSVENNIIGNFEIELLNLGGFH